MDMITLTLSRADAELVELALEHRANRMADVSLSANDSETEMRYRALVLRLRDIVANIQKELEVKP